MPLCTLATESDHSMSLINQEASIIASYSNHDEYLIYHYSSPPLVLGGTFQDPQWMPETTDSEPHIYCGFSCTYIPMIKFNL